MKKFLKKSGKVACAAALAMCVWGGVSTADPALSINGGFKLPFGLLQVDGTKEKAMTTFLDPDMWTGWDAQDFRFNFHSDYAGININLRPDLWSATTDNNGQNMGKLGIKEYSAWFSPFEGFTVSFGNSEERHWYKGTDERVNNNFGEISIIDCDNDSKTGVYYGLIGDPTKGFDSKKDGNILGRNGWGIGDIGQDTVNARMYGWDSAAIGSNFAIGLRASYAQGEDGFFAKLALSKYRSAENKEGFQSFVTDKRTNSIDLIAGIEAEVGYAFENAGSIELIYKTLTLGNNVLAAYWQPRFLDGALFGTLGVTGVFDVRDGSSKYYQDTANGSWNNGNPLNVSRNGDGVANKFNAFAVDLRLGWKPTDKLSLLLYGNFSMIKPGDEGEAPSWAHYTNKKGQIVDDAELGGYVVASVGYQLPIGSVNLDAGVYFRDIDNNDGYDMGENMLVVKAGWTNWLPGGAGVGIGAEWYHALNTGDLAADKPKDRFWLGAYLEVWLGN